MINPRRISVPMVIDQKGRLNLFDKIISEAELKEDGTESAEYIKNEILKNFSSLVIHRNILSELFSYDIPDILKNLVKYVLHYDEEPSSNRNLNRVLQEICHTYLRSGSRDDKTIERAKEIFACARDNYFKFDDESEDITRLEGGFYPQINYKSNAKTNAASLYNAKIHQQHTTKKYLNALKLLKDLETCSSLIRAECDSFIKYFEVILKNIEPNAKTDWRKATKEDWKIHVKDQRFDIESKIENFLKQACLDNNLSFEELLQKALVKTQRDVLSGAINAAVGDITLSNDECNFNSSITPVTAMVNPAPIRSAYKLFGTNEREKDLPINVFGHDITIDGNNKMRLASSVIRNGFCHSLEAAKIYVEIMVERAQKNPSKDRPIIIVDNRLMYDVDGFWGGERKYLNKHKEYINEAIALLIKGESRSLPEIRFIPLNFPPKDHRFVANKEPNRESLLQLHEAIQALPEHPNLLENNLLYKLCYKLFRDCYQNSDYYAGETAFNFALVIQIMLSFLPVEFSEGCKSNKDRGGSKKWHDEVFSYILNSLINKVHKGDLAAESLMGLSIEEVFTIDEYNRQSARSLALQSTGALITQANSGVSGSKNTAGVRSLIKTLGIEKYFFTGNRELVKRVQS